jgi:hypothetical protein
MLDLDSITQNLDTTFIRATQISAVGTPLALYYTLITMIKSLSLSMTPRASQVDI